MKDQIRYRTAGGNIVTWKRPKPANPAAHPYGEYTCDGCGESRGGVPSAADEHAQVCRAL